MNDGHRDRPGGMMGAYGRLLRSDKTRSAVAGVSPPTSKGIRNTVLWLVAFGVIVFAGRTLAPGLGAWWGVIGLAVMVPIGWSWPFGSRR